MNWSPWFLAAGILLCVGCDKSPPAAGSSSGSATPSSAPLQDLSAWFTDAPPPLPQPIHLLREQAKPGDEITVSGIVMGRREPFVEHRAAFVLGDPALLTPCNRRPEDSCKTPWDACCDTKEDKLAGTATIQLVDETGRVLPQGVKGAHGLTELSAVTLTGVVAPSSTPESLVINATLLHVGPQP